jgi:formylglycine-generating enzyme required for sulfatase activity
MIQQESSIGTALEGQGPTMWQHHRAELPKDIIASEATVTNAEFSRFVAETNYKTTAEIPLDPKSAQGMPDDYFAAGSLVFHLTDGPVNLGDVRTWGDFVPEANWRHPDGPMSSIKERMDHPVVQVSLIDAQAYAAWASKRLPSETQWEFAARDGVETTYPWGDDLAKDGLVRANTWQGSFPWHNTNQAPYLWPSTSGDPSRYGLYNMIGNVWEWTVDSYHPVHGRNNPCCTPARLVFEGNLFAVKGGSFLCAPSYCRRYRATARSPQEGRSSTNHLGFRCVQRG